VISISSHSENVFSVFLRKIHQVQGQRNPATLPCHWWCSKLYSLHGNVIALFWAKSVGRNFLQDTEAPLSTDYCGRHRK